MLRLLDAPAYPPPPSLLPQGPASSPRPATPLTPLRTMATTTTTTTAAAATTTAAPTVDAAASSAAAAAALANADAEQARLMAERVLLVDANDTVTGSATKVDAHLLSAGLPLHRAFSVFLFNADGQLCLQKRAATKLTFPGYWTNTCCSHPLAGGVEADGVAGAAAAAVRKLGHELGIRRGGPRALPPTTSST
eukprot:TRINITY_DN21142_c0_g1_i1.p3 TRINITY_DN21142_c0_g1~~TRINITY_DN21142_c0_g1_i1.p3  ORF type:complete len:194 (-),score=68.50 TRINITY_DN21142_c0_g1_i1:49-630(-)